MFINRILALLLGLAARASACSVRYVSATTGDDASSGCLPAAPLLTLAACIDAVGSDGVCYVFPGRYREASAPAGKHVESVRNLTIARAPAALTMLLFNESFAQLAATVDGTLDLGAAGSGSGWERLSDVHGAYYRSTIPYNATVWQLFVDGAPLTSARWPNAAAWSDEWWDRERGWARHAESSKCGHTVDNGTALPAPGDDGHQSLASTGVSYDGCNLYAVAPEPTSLSSD